MAFNIDPSISLGVKPPQNMSLADMVNMARGLQEYQKAQAVNPSLIRQIEAEAQKAETEAGVSKETATPRIEQQAAQTGLAKTQEKAGSLKFQNEQADIINNEANALKQDKRISEATNDPAGRKNAMSALIESKKRALKRGVDEHLAEAIFAPYMSMASGDPTGISQEIENSTRAGTGSVGQAALINPQLMTNAQGQIVKVKLLAADDRGRLKLSMKALSPEEGGPVPAVAQQASVAVEEPVASPAGEQPADQQ